MENGSFEDVFPIENGDFSIAMLDYRRVSTQIVSETCVGYYAWMFQEVRINGL